MQIIFGKRQNVLVAKLFGDLDHHSCDYFKMKMDSELKRPGIKGFVIDLSDVSFMDSSGMGLIVGRQRLAVQRGITMILAEPSFAVSKVIELTGLNKYIEIAESTDKAVLTLKSLLHNR